MPKPTPHDALFKRVFSWREDAIGELERVLPAELLDELDLEALVVEDRSSVDPELVDRHTDQLYSVPIAGQQGFVYVLLEHKSRADRWTALWLLGYMVRIWEGFLEDEPGAAELPPIVPVGGAATAGGVVVGRGACRWRLRHRPPAAATPARAKAA